MGLTHYPWHSLWRPRTRAAIRLPRQSLTNVAMPNNCGALPLKCCIAPGVISALLS